MRGTISRVLRAREAGAVERCHNMPHHGSYSVAAHSWGVAVLLCELHPGPRPELLWAALYHDFAERWTGDMPNGPLPAGLPRVFAEKTTEDRQDFRGALASYESTVLQAFGKNHGAMLDPAERVWLRACDTLELWLWCQDQSALGNRHVEPMAKRLYGWLVSKDQPAPVRDFVMNFKWRRTGP